MSSTRSAQRYVPEPEGLNREFFRQAAGGTIHLQRCEQCGEHRFPPRRYCRHCFSGDWEWDPSGGTGTIVSWVTSWFTRDPGWVDDVPYTTVVVQLDEGPRLLGAMRGMTVEDLEIGTRVVVRPEPIRDDFVFFWVEPVHTG
jgi:uncharacterized protein